MAEEKNLLLPPKSAIQPDDSGRILTRSIHDTRLYTVTYSVAIALIGSLLFGYAIGYSSPVISDLEEKNENNDSYLGRNEYQGVFSVRHSFIGSCCAFNIILLIFRRLCQ